MFHISSINIDQDMLVESFIITEYNGIFGRDTWTGHVQDMSRTLKFSLDIVPYQHCTKVQSLRSQTPYEFNLALGFILMKTPKLFVKICRYTTRSSVTIDGGEKKR